MVLLLLVSLIGYFLFISRVCKWPIAVTPLFTICLIPSLLYLAALLNILAVSANLLFYMGVVFFVAYILLCFKERQIPYEDIFNPGLIVFIFYFVLLYLVCRPMFYCGWDEFSHWGLVTKDIVFNNKLTTLDSAVVLKSYPPGIALFHYFIVLIAGYSEGTVLFAHNLLFVSAVIPFFQRIRWKQPYLLILVFSISCILFYVFSGLHSGSLMADSIVGTIFGMSIASYFLFKGSNIGRLTHLIPVLFFLPLTKQVGIYLALSACAIIVLDYLQSFFYRKPEMKGNKQGDPDPEESIFAWQKSPGRKNIILTSILLCAVVAAPLISHFTWKQRLNKYKIQEIFSTDFPLEKIKNTFLSGKQTERDKKTLINFKKALNEEAVITLPKIAVWGNRIDFDKWVSTVSFFFICLIMAIISILSQSTALNRRRIFLCQSVLALSFLSYCFIHLLLYLYSIGEYEGTRIVSFSRYMSIFFSGWFYIFIGLFLVNLKKLNLPYGFLRLILKMLIIFSALVSLFLFKTILFAKKPYPPYRVEVAQNMPVVNKYCPLNSKVYFIWQNDGDLGLKKCVFGYEICPRKTNFWDWSLGSPYFKGDVWTTDYTPGQLLNIFSGYDYILIAKADEKFWKRYGALFKDADLTKYSLSADIHQKTSSGNLLRDGTIITIEQGPLAWGGWTSARVNDGVTDAKPGNAYGYTLNDAEMSNNGRGLTLTFNRSVALTTLVHWAYSNLTFNYVIEYFANGAWKPVATIASRAGSPAVISFNVDRSKSSTQWRWYISGWNNPGTNFYSFELEAYETIQNHPEYNNLLIGGALFKIIKIPNGNISIKRIE